MPPPSDQSHPFFLPGKPCLLRLPPLSDLARPPCQACPAYTPPAQAVLPSQSLTRGHLATAPEADALVLVTLDPSGLLWGAVLRAGPHAGVALGAAERLRVGRWKESMDSCSGDSPQVGQCRWCPAPGRSPAEATPPALPGLPRAGPAPWHTCTQIREDVVSHEFGVAQVCPAAAHLRVVGRQRHVI